MRAKRNTEPCPPHSMCAEFGDRGGLGVAERASRDRLRSAALSVVAVMALLLASCGTSVDDSRSDRTATTQASITVGTIPAATPTTVVGAKPESPGNGISGGAADSSEPPTVDEPTTSAADSAGQQDDQSGEPVEESAEQDISEPAEGDEPQADDSSVGAAETSSVARILSLLDALDVTAETSGGYDRALFKHWVDADGDGCDARREVLIAEAVAAPSVGSRCSLSGGEWLSRYDGKTASGNGSAFDVDHMVPLAEAWESGAHNWTAERREDYANDLGYADSLIAVSASSNRSKGARDPVEWLPPAEGVHCWYAAAWINVKTRWELTVDQTEADTLRSVLAGCDDNDLDNLPEAQPVAEATEPEIEPEPAGDCHPAYEPCLPNLPGDALNCGDLTSGQKPVRVKEIGVDPYRLDRDGDGQGCTS